MRVVAIYKLQGSPEELAAKLGTALNILPYEARARVIAPGGGPAVVGCFAEAGAAATCASRLREEGFAVLELDSAAAEREAARFIAHQLTLTDAGLAAVDRQGGRLLLPWSEIRLLLRGTGIITTTTTSTTKEKKFSPGLAVATGGLMMRKTVKSTSESTTQERQPFLLVYASGRQPLLVRQDQTDYSTLGEQRQLSREANYNWICAELRRRAPQAVYDDRLQTRPGQAQLLGSTLPPEQHLDLAITLLARAAGAFPR
ncbi:hypothetical protein JCM30471_31920 [Desulfuromonas carbonis]|uniref:hypothetical protein n=1 Tax=Desulfuromonas sp. DDH964 TaxID=1823759 RepID=UPI00078E7F23|nr:hypothetical protein [Desulfuromonas sp. DDH964]AMV71355.1 hypothetical protein DBW_0973 [Desulfuromonas sp. DDH964]